MRAGASRWCRAAIAGALVVVGGCVSAAPERTAEVPPVRLRAPSGVQARCGLEMIREVQRANDLAWTEVLYWWSAQAEARRAVRDEEAWRQRCVERYRQQGYEVVSTPR